MAVQMRQFIDPKILRQRQRESYDRLGFFLFDKRSPPAIRKAFAPQECLMLLHRIVGGQNYSFNLKTVWYVVSQYVKHYWGHYEFSLWHWSLRTLHHKTPAEIDMLLGGDGMEDEIEEEWPETLEVK